MCRTISRDNSRDSDGDDDDHHPHHPNQGTNSRAVEIDEEEGGMSTNTKSNNTHTGGDDVQALTDEQVEEAKEAFAVFVDEEGLVDIQNLGAMMRALECKLTEDDIQKLTDQYDHTHFERGGKIDFFSFMTMVKPLIIKAYELYSDASMERLFQEFDSDGDGYISGAELRQSLQKLGDKFAAVAEELTDEDVEEIMLESDLDGDGRISYSEFSIMIPRLNRIIDE